LLDTSGDINAIWERERQVLPPRILSHVDNIQLLRRSAEDAKQDAKQWAAMSGETDPTREVVDSGVVVDDNEESRKTYRSDNIGNATRLIDVLRSSIASQQITAGSNEILAMVQKLYRFQGTALCSTDDLGATTIVPERRERTLSAPGQPFSGAEIPSQEHLRHIKSQQKSLSKEREMMIQGIQGLPNVNTTGHSAAVHSVLNGSGDQNVDITATDSEILVQGTEPSMDIRFGPSTSFCEAGRQVAWARSGEATERCARRE
jgi:hypothetical protein